MNSAANNWKLDPRLEQDTLPISFNGTFETRLMNDARWPWIIVVPTGLDMSDLDHMPPELSQLLTVHLHHISATLKQMGVCNSTNVASLGNVVTQMHWHVVGRSQGDPNWPGSVWGYGKAKPYEKQRCAEFIKAFKKIFEKLQ